MLNLRRLSQGYNARTRSYAELLPWFRLVTDGVVLNTDGSLMAGLEFDGLDLESTGAQEVQAALGSLEAAMQAFDDTCTLWSFLDKRSHSYADDGQVSPMANEVARWADALWREHVQAGGPRRLRHVVFVASQPFSGAHGFMEELSLRMSEHDEALPRAAWRTLQARVRREEQIVRLQGRVLGAIARFEDRLRQFVDTLGARLPLRRLAGQALLAELSNRCNPASPRDRVSLPPDDLYFLNTLLPTDTPLREADGLIRFEGAARTVHVQMHSVKGYPGVASNDDVERILAIPADFTLAQMYRFLDRERARRMVQDLEAHYRSSVKSPLVQIVEKISGVQSQRVNTGQQVLADDAQSALVEATVDGVGFGYHTMVVQLLAERREQLQHASRAVYGALAGSGWGLVRETLNAFGAFAATIPGAASAVTRTSLVSTRNLADLTVVRTLKAGLARNAHLSEQRGVPSPALALLPSATDVPQMFNLHVGDVGHFMIVGPAGQGKSTLVNFLLLCWQRYAPCRVIVIDKDRSNHLTITALGGRHVDLARAGEVGARMNPARWLAERRHWPQLRAWIEVAMRAVDAQPLLPSEIRQLDLALAMAAQQHAQGSPATMSLIHALLDGQNKALAQRLHPWTRQSERYGALFDNEHDEFELGEITGIEVGGVLREPAVASAFFAYLFGVVDEIVDSRRPTLIYLEEAWYLLGDPGFRAIFEDWIRTMRKRNAAVGLATQSVRDIASTPLSSVLNDNIRTRLFLPNLQALDSLDVYRDAFGLEPREIEIIRSATPKRHYYLVQDRLRRLLDVRLPPRILALTRSDPRAREIFERERQRGGPAWLERYVQEVCADD